MINKVLILGGGTAGLIAAIALKKLNPALSIELIRSKAIGGIGVGEGTTVYFPGYFHDILGVGQKRFFDAVQPTWKMGLRFKWGPRKGGFCYPFDAIYSAHGARLSKVDAFYADADPEASSRITALMENDRVFERDPSGAPIPHNAWGYHLENRRLVSYLEGYVANLGVALRDEKVEHVRQDENGISELILASGEHVTADLYVDSSGFVSLLLGKALNEPFVSFKSSLQNNRAVSGGWLRTNEIIQPYTACDTMNAGWCWQIDHEDCINCGYVYSSDFISDADAEAEFRKYKPKVKDTFQVKFISGRYQRGWVKNVVAIGNSSGFVEPLEATALAVICMQTAVLSKTLITHDREPRPALVNAFNRHHSLIWDDIRDFLYRFNTMLDTPYWQFCRNETNLAGAAPIVEYYQQCGPSELHNQSGMFTAPLNQFGLNGYYVLLLGQGVPFQKTYTPSAAEWKHWESEREKHRAAARRAFTAAEMLAYMRSPKWRWRS